MDATEVVCPASFGMLYGKATNAGISRARLVTVVACDVIYNVISFAFLPIIIGRLLYRGIFSGGSPFWWPLLARLSDAAAIAKGITPPIFTPPTPSRRPSVPPSDVAPREEEDAVVSVSTGQPDAALSEQMDVVVPAFSGPPEGGSILPSSRPNVSAPISFKRPDAVIAKPPRRRDGTRERVGIPFDHFKIVGDGNCFFRAIALQVYGDEKKWRRVRDECFETGRGMLRDIFGNPELGNAFGKNENWPAAEEILSCLQDLLSNGWERTVREFWPGKEKISAHISRLLLQMWNGNLRRSDEGIAENIDKIVRLKKKFGIGSTTDPGKSATPLDFTKDCKSFRDHLDLLETKLRQLSGEQKELEKKMAKGSSPEDTESLKEVENFLDSALSYTREAKGILPTMERMEKGNFSENEKLCFLIDVLLCEIKAANPTLHNTLAAEFQRHQLFGNHRTEFSISWMSDASCFVEYLGNTVNRNAAFAEIDHRSEFIAHKKYGRSFLSYSDRDRNRAVVYTVLNDGDTYACFFPENFIEFLRACVSYIEEGMLFFARLKGDGIIHGNFPKRDEFDSELAWHRRCFELFGEIIRAVNPIGFEHVNGNHFNALVLPQ
jgi:hypothetical protein